MPWDSTRLVWATLTLEANRLPSLVQKKVLCAAEDVAVAEPQFTADGRYLVYISDARGWNMLYRYDLQSGAHRPLTRLPTDDAKDQAAEAGRPAWQQGVRSYSISADSRWIFFARTHHAFTQLWRVSIEGNDEKPVTSALAHYTHLIQPTIAVHNNRLAAIVAASDIPTHIVSVDLHGGAPERIHAYSTAERVATDLFSRPEPLQWRAPNGDMVYGLFYPPHNPAFHSSGKPPLMVLVHGGPTSQTPATYNPQVQFFTTRGFSVLVVNYRGSTGYGKAYLKQLRGNWGIYDVEDTVSGAQHLVQTGQVDPKRLVVMGGSAGGFTTLLCLIHHPGFFRAGVCLYGVSNLFTLAADTHKFEERYLDSMIGPLPETAHLYRERSAIFHIDKIQDPLAIFQGDIDRVVPREQSDSIVESLRRRGVPHEYHLYAGEGHGWRKSETVEHFYTAVMRFLRQYVLFS
jgi:dipeptidyl aminopeptidase/acylaminoacyl peptidase